VRLAALLAVMLLSPTVPLQAQEKSLADIARESREKKAQSSKPAKVITNEELGGGAPEPVKATDDPVQVVGRARIGLLRDTLHVCRREASGNSGPGWTDSRLIEVAGDRKHFITSTNDIQQGHNQYTIIVGRVYMKAANGPWQRPADKPGIDETKVAQMVEGLQLPDVLNFRYDSGTLKLIRNEAVEGAPAFLYQYHAQAGDMERTISIWVGANDGLFRKSDMQTTTRSTLGGPATVWRETATCAYGGIVMIEAPL
jgi:hypothetical protein